MSVAWTLKLGAATKTLEDWGILVSSCVLNFHPLQADEFSFSFEEEDVLAEPLVAYGDSVTLYRDGVIYYIGTIRQLPAAGSPRAESNRYIAKNIWWELENLIYQQARYVINDAFDSLVGQDTTQIVLGSSNLGAKITTDVQIDNLVAFAIAQGVSFAAATGFTGVEPPYEEAREISVANAIRRMCAWTPDIVCQCVYTTGTPTLTFLRRADCSDQSINLSAGTVIESWNINPRNDLVPAGVVFKFLGGNVNSADGNRYLHVTAQTAGSTSGVAVIQASITLAGTGGSVTEPVPSGLAAAYYAALSTLFYEGEVNFRELECSGIYRPGQRLNFTNGRSAWASAQALIQQVTEKLGSGETSVSFGPPAFLTPDDLMGLASRMRRVHSTSPSGLPAVKNNDGILGDPSDPTPVAPNTTTAPIAGVDQLSVLTGNQLSSPEAGKAMAKGLAPNTFPIQYPYVDVDICVSGDTHTMRIVGVDLTP